MSNVIKSCNDNNNMVLASVIVCSWHCLNNRKTQAVCWVVEGTDGPGGCHTGVINQLSNPKNRNEFHPTTQQALDSSKTHPGVHTWDREEEKPHSDPLVGGVTHKSQTITRLNYNNVNLYTDDTLHFHQVRGFFHWLHKCIHDDEIQHHALRASISFRNEKSKENH